MSNANVSSIMSDLSRYQYRVTCRTCGRLNGVQERTVGMTRHCGPCNTGWYAKSEMIIRPVADYCDDNGNDGTVDEAMPFNRDGLRY